MRALIKGPSLHLQLILSCQYSSHQLTAMRCLSFFSIISIYYDGLTSILVRLLICRYPDYLICTVFLGQQLSSYPSEVKCITIISGRQTVIVGMMALSIVSSLCMQTNGSANLRRVNDTRTFRSIIQEKFPHKPAAAKWPYKATPCRSTVCRHLELR